MSTTDRPIEIAAVEGPGSQPRRADRQRGRWNFLTWSFFLAEVMAGAQFLGSGAKAAHDLDDDGAARSKTLSDATHDELQGSLGLGEGSTAADEGNGVAATQTEARAAHAGGLFQRPHVTEAGASTPISTGVEQGDFEGTSASGSGASGEPGSSSLESAQAESGTCGQLREGCSTHWNCLPIDTDGTIADPAITQVPIFGPHFGIGISPIVDAVVDVGSSQGVTAPVHGSGVALSQILDTKLDQVVSLPLLETVDGLIAPIGDGGVAGVLPSLLGDAVDSTLSQINALHLGEVTGELTALVDRASDSLLTQAGQGLASSVGPLASTVTDLGLLGDVGHVLSDGTVSQVVYTASSQVAGMQLVEDAGSALGNALAVIPSESTDVLTPSNIGTSALDIVSDAAELAPLGHDGDVSSGGAISFPESTSASVHQIDDLFAGGRHTDYGLALQSEVNSGVTAVGGMLSSDNGTSNSPIDSSTDGQESAPTSGEQDVDASLANLPSTIEELGVRDL